MKKYLLAVVIAGIWMNLNEFVRNELVLKSYWVDGFSTLGLVFPGEPVNGVIWMLWAFLFVAMMLWLRRSIGEYQSVLLSWGLGYVLMWIALGNVGVLPKGLLYVAAPWSFAEVYVAALIGRYIDTERG